jgi:purine nucleoside phosphorylase
MSDLALIVGSGFSLLKLEIVARSPTKTPYGAPSGPILTAAFGAHRVLCCARHGETHALAPHEINYRANLWALHAHGARRCIALNAVGAIARRFRPGDLAVPEQLIDYTWGRVATFGGDGNVVHIDVTQPFDAVLAGKLVAAIAACGRPPGMAEVPRVAGAARGYSVQRGVYGVTQGPRLETAAEIDRLERDGCAMVGMTAMPEAALARELSLDYAICAVAVNYAAGRSPDGAAISKQIELNLAVGMQRAAQVLQRLIPDLCTEAL